MQFYGLVFLQLYARVLIYLLFNFDAFWRKINAKPVYVEIYQSEYHYVGM